LQYDEAFARTGTPRQTPTEHIRVPSNFQVLSLVSLVALSSAAQADSFYCGNQIVSEGMTAGAIEERCGKPQRVERVEEPAFARRANGSTYRVGTSVYELWTYERAQGQFPARIKIEDGKAKKIALVTRR
jgi:hypothetical protein